MAARIYRLDWIIEEILQTELSANLSEAFEESVRSTLESETITVGWMTLDAITVMKDKIRFLGDALVEY